MSSITIRSPYFPGRSRIAIDDLRGDALMQRIADLVEDDTLTYTICRSINDPTSIGVMLSYTQFNTLNTLATGDKPPAYNFADVTDDWMIPNLNVAFDIITGNEQQSLASENRYVYEGSKAEFDTASTTGGIADVGAPILEPDRTSVALVTGGADLTGGAFEVSGPGGTVTIAENTGEAMVIRYNKQHYSAFAIRRTATPLPTGGDNGAVGTTGAARSRRAVLISKNHYDGLTGVQP